MVVVRIVALVLIAFPCMTHGSAFAEEVTRVFLFAGQSNMVGADAHADRIDDYPNFKGAGEPQSDVLYSYILGDGDQASKGWVPLKPLQSLGPEVTYARRVRQHAPFPIAIIKSAVGGRSEQEGRCNFATIDSVVGAYGTRLACNVHQQFPILASVIEVTFGFYYECKSWLTLSSGPGT